MRKKILFMAEGITMAHFVRPAALAESLDAGEWDVYFWAPKRYHRLLRQTFSRLGDLRTIDPKVFLEAQAYGSRMYSHEAIRNYVHDDQAIFREVRPDLVIGDLRLSLCISAPLCKVPFASITNAHWSPFYNQPAIFPEMPITQWVSPQLMNLLFVMLRAPLLAWQAKPVNDLRRSYGLLPLSYQTRGLFTAGDLVFYADVPEFVPIQGMPSHHHFLGKCSWEIPTSKPTWWSEVMASPRPKIFVALGSSGSIKVLPAVLQAMVSLPVDVLLATSGRPVGSIPDNVHVSEFLPYEETSRHSAVVVSQGGTAGLYMTLAAGTPILAIPNNVDNHQSTDLLVKSGAGLGIRTEYASTARLRNALQRILTETTFKDAARKWAGVLSRHETREIFPNLLRRWFAERNSAVQ
jgi:UDP:flavonoid glycosyltransferase YjiC (YdhE family)